MIKAKISTSLGDILFLHSLMSNFQTFLFTIKALLGTENRRKHNTPIPMLTGHNAQYINIYHTIFNIFKVLTPANSKIPKTYQFTTTRPSA